jgi:hypothetical protein
MDPFVFSPDNSTKYQIQMELRKQLSNDHKGNKRPTNLQLIDLPWYINGGDYKEQ